MPAQHHAFDTHLTTLIADVIDINLLTRINIKIINKSVNQ